MLKHVLFLLVFSLLAATACNKEIDVDNLLGRVTSIGPVYQQEDGLYTIHFSIFDRDGDPTDVTAEYRLGDGQAWQEIPACDAQNVPDCQLVGGLLGLGTDLGVAVQHQVAWDAPDELRGRNIQLRMRSTEDVTRGVASEFRLER